MTIKNKSIKSWAEQDRPREKLLQKGVASLSDAELLAIIIGSGTFEISAVDLSKNILSSVENNLDELGRKSILQLKQFKGIGEAKAVTIAATMELGRRRQLVNPIEKPIISSSKEAYNCIAPILQDLDHEQLWLLCLNNRNELIFRTVISQGGPSATIADNRSILKVAIENLAASIILVHNHPSGSTKPSRQDIEITKSLYKACSVMNIRFADHLIISKKSYYSFADEGEMDG